MNRIIVSILLISGMIPLQQCSKTNDDRLFDVTELKGKSPSAVYQILQTKPDSAFTRHFVEGDRFIQLYYDKDSSEFRYRAGKLMEIIIHKPDIDYLPESIEYFGLNYRTPSSADTSSYIRWDDYPGFKAVSFYMVGNKKSTEGSKIFKAYFNYMN